MSQYSERAHLIEQNEQERERRYEMCLSFSQIKYMVIQYLNTPMRICNYNLYVNYYTPIQIECDIDMLNNNQSLPKLFLGVLITDYQIDKQKIYVIDYESIITATYDFNQYRRNIFSFESITSRVPGSPVLYGEEFYIRLTFADRPALYLTGLVEFTDNYRHFKDNVKLYLTTNPDYYSRFHFVDPIPEIYHNLMYTPVLTFRRNLIVHSVTDSVLTADLGKSILSTYSVDHPVKCSPYKNNHGVFTEYYWRIITQNCNENSVLTSYYS